MDGPPSGKVGPPASSSSSSFAHTAPQLKGAPALGLSLNTTSSSVLGNMHATATQPLSPRTVYPPDIYSGGGGRTGGNGTFTIAPDGYQRTVQLKGDIGRKNAKYFYSADGSFSRHRQDNGLRDKVAGRAMHSAARKKRDQEKYFKVEHHSVFKEPGRVPDIDHSLYKFRNDIDEQLLGQDVYNAFRKARSRLATEQLTEKDIALGRRDFPQNAELAELAAAEAKRARVSSNMSASVAAGTGGPVSFKFHPDLHKSPRTLMEEFFAEQEQHFQELHGGSGSPKKSQRVVRAGRRKSTRAGAGADGMTSSVAAMGQTYHGQSGSEDSSAANTERFTNGRAGQVAASLPMVVPLMKAVQGSLGGKPMSRQERWLLKQERLQEIERSKEKEWEKLMNSFNVETQAQHEQKLAMSLSLPGGNTSGSMDATQGSTARFNASFAAQHEFVEEESPEGDGAASNNDSYDKDANNNHSNNSNNSNTSSGNNGKGANVAISFGPNSVLNLPESVVAQLTDEQKFLMYLGSRLGQSISSQDRLRSLGNRFSPEKKKTVLTPAQRQALYVHRELSAAAMTARVAEEEAQQGGKGVSNKLHITTADLHGESWQPPKLKPGQMFTPAEQAVLDMKKKFDLTVKLKVESEESEKRMVALAKRHEEKKKRVQELILKERKQEATKANKELEKQVDERIAAVEKPNEQEGGEKAVVSDPAKAEGHVSGAEKRQVVRSFLKEIYDFDVANKKRLNRARREKRRQVLAFTKESADAQKERLAFAIKHYSEEGIRQAKADYQAYVDKIRANMAKQAEIAREGREKMRRARGEAEIKMQQEKAAQFQILLRDLKTERATKAAKIEAETAKKQIEELDQLQRKFQVVAEETSKLLSPHLEQLYLEKKWKEAELLTGTGKRGEASKEAAKE